MTICDLLKTFACGWAPGDCNRRPRPQALQKGKHVNTENATDPDKPTSAAATITVDGIGSVILSVEAIGAKAQRLIGAKIGDVRHHDRIDTASATRRKQFIFSLADKAQASRDALYAALDWRLVELGDKTAAKTTGSKDRTGDNARESQATLISELAEAAKWELWHTAGGDAYATVPVAGHLENWPVASRGFKGLVGKTFYETTGKAAGNEAVSAAVNLFDARGVHGGPEYLVFVRVAEQGGNVYVDLCDDDWRAVEITPAGWSIVDQPPVRFRRSKGMQPLPPPERGAKVDDLRRFINVDDTDWPLVVAWLLAALRPRGPYTLLCLFSTQGAGKSTAAKIFHRLIDPHDVELLPEPRSTDDLMISAVNTWCLTFDNLSRLDDRLSDAMCRISTGAGYRKRALFFDADEVILKATRPMILTSIVDLAEQSDLLDRCLLVRLPPIPDEKRRDEETLLAEFEAAKPAILGALFDGVAGALAELPRVKLHSPPRMADFARWATAAEPAFTWPPGTFMAAYTRNRHAAHDLALEASPIAGRLTAFLADREQWEGTASELLDELNATFHDDLKRPNRWPKAAHILSRDLNRLAPNLPAAGWHFHRAHSGKTWLTFSRVDATNNGPEASHDVASMPASTAATAQNTSETPPLEAVEGLEATFTEPVAAGKACRERGEL